MDTVSALCHLRVDCNSSSCGIATLCTWTKVRVGKGGECGANVKLLSMLVGQF
jgi:hypothetical protein